MPLLGDRTTPATIGELIDFFENAAIGLQSIGPDGAVQWANQALLDLLGFERDEYLGHHIGEFHADPDVMRAFMDRLTAGETLRDFQAPLRCRDGSIKHVLIDANVYREDGQFVHTRCFVRDVTERKRLEEQLAEHARQLAEADRCKDEFLANLSHELRTPLNVMLGWSRLLQAGQLDESQRANAIATIERNVAAQARLIEDLLDVSRIISGKLALEANPVSLSQLVAGVVDSEVPIARSRGVELTFDSDEAGPIVIGDSSRLQQIASNLISNALKFTPSGGHVRVSVSHAASSVVLRVVDDGRGIDAAFLPLVFERFRQADGTSRRGQSGLGLGLAIVRDLVQLHGGEVVAESDGEGRGATFTAMFPLAALRFRELTPPYGERVAPLPLPSALLHGVSVLIVDDQPDACDLMSTILESCGARVVTAGSVADALAAVVHEQPDVLISDIGLPGQDGYDLIRALRALPAAAGGDVPAAALTAYAHPEDRLRALRAGFDLHLGKPVAPEDLIATVKTLVGARQGRRFGNSATDASRPRVLVIDDDRDIRAALHETLTEQGYEVMTAADGFEAIEKLRVTRAQLILLDLSMPRMDGVEFRKYQRNNPALASIPTVVITAIDRGREQIAPYEPDGYLPKPLHPDKLVEVIEHFVAPMRASAGG